MDFLIPLAILSVVWGISEIISIRTKAIFSTVFVALSILLIGSWTNIIPVTLVEQSGLAPIATVSLVLTLVHMGTTLDLEIIKKDWKLVVICLVGLVTLLLGMFTIGTIVIGKEFAYTSGPLIYGGGTPALVFTSALGDREGMEHVIAFAWLVSSVQMFVGVPLVSIFLRKFSKQHLKNDTVYTLSSIESNINSGENKSKTLLPEKYQGTFVILSIVILLGLLAEWIGIYTNKYLAIHPYVLAMILGYIAVRIGLLPKNALVKANSYGFLVFGMFVYIGSVTVDSVSLEVFKSLIIPVCLAFVLGVVFLMIGVIVAAKYLKYDINLAIAIGATCMVGFPSTIIIAEETANALGRNEEEKKIFNDFLVPKMLISGLLMVTLLSGIVASFIAPLI